MENLEIIELSNNGKVKAVHVKNVIHYVCRAALHESELNGTPNDVISGIEVVERHLRQYSAAYTKNSGVKVVTYDDSLLKYCFNQHNEIPGYICYWLYQFYGGLFGSPMKYSKRHCDVYNQLQKEYVHHRRRCKQNDKNDEIMRRKWRRQLCKLYRSRKYQAMFELHNTSFLDSISQKQLDDIWLLMIELFPKELNACDDEAYTAALGYIIGKAQGLSEAAQSA